ncbi:YlcI/YnfO family protein [Klebsiella aerogenes]|uniref:YlcI/YnfO family protein n=1 Tax=Klebsiella aerogenes TaxID=548 RepID=UPI002E31086C|nr:YlcI/YnfO family protein [Klebsiella aerogenes]
MSSKTTNNKSKQISIRIPHDVLDDVESVKFSDETMAMFIVTAMRGEIFRRKHEEDATKALVTSIENTAYIRDHADDILKAVKAIIKLADKSIG